MSAQNYQSHAQRVPAYLAMLFVLLCTFIGGAINLFHSLDDHQRLYSASLILVLSGCVLVCAVYVRTFPLKAQDRAIRSEENLRHYVLTGKLLDPRLQPRQIIALRFASDAEFPDLAKRAADQNMAPGDIKRAVKNWRADTYRV